MSLRFVEILSPFVSSWLLGVPLTIAYWPVLSSSPTSDSVVTFSKVNVSPVERTCTVISDAFAPSSNSALMIAFGL